MLVADNSVPSVGTALRASTLVPNDIAVRTAKLRESQLLAVHIEERFIMRTLTFVTSALAASLFSVTSYAQEQPANTAVPKATSSSEAKAPSKTLEVSTRIGYSLPAGSTSENNSLGDTVSGQLPVQIDVGYRINSHFYIGAYGQLGTALLKGDCADTNCSARNTRVGVSAQYYILPEAKFTPWLGVGTGYEWLTVKQSIDGENVSSTLHGFEFVNLQIGGDYRVSNRFALGPFASASLGQYSQGSVGGSDGEVSSAIDKPALHQWITLGLKGTFDL